MSMNDPIADMLTRLRNANQALHKETVMPASKIKVGVMKILKDNGFISDFSIEEKGIKKTIRVTLKYGLNQERVLQGIQRTSRGSRRVYVNRDELPKVQGGLGVAILTTSKGIITDAEARREGIGGELICKVW